jgi:glycosyltransferase involved in cell wall biosynthesis
LAGAGVLSELATQTLIDRAFARGAAVRERAAAPVAEPPLVSVVTPAHNEEAHIAQCIESVLAQTYQNWEYTIVDNCSTDRTAQIAEAYAADDRRVHVHRNANFVSAIANHNIAFRLIASGSKYCKVIPGDDWMFPACLEKLVGFAERNPTVAIVGCYRLSGERLNPDGPPYPQAVISGREICRRFLLGGPYFPALPNNLLYRAEIVRATDPFFPGDYWHADSEACFNTLERADLGFVHEILTFDRVRSGSMTSQARADNRYLIEMLDYLAKFGSRYLSEIEMRQRIAEVLSAYHAYLAERMHERDARVLWSRHRQRVAALGYRLSPLRVTVKSVMHVAEATIRRIGRRL